MNSENTIYDIVIGGQGAAAFAAGMYAARYQMSAIIVGTTFGGETATGGLIENYPGYPEIDGFELMMKFREHAEKYDVPHSIQLFQLDPNIVSILLEKVNSFLCGNYSS